MVFGEERKKKSFDIACLQKYNHVFHNQNMILSTPSIKTISLVFDEDMAHSLDEAEGLEVAEVVVVNFNQYGLQVIQMLESWKLSEDWPIDRLIDVQISLLQCNNINDIR